MSTRALQYVRTKLSANNWDLTMLAREVGLSRKQVTENLRLWAGRPVGSGTPRNGALTTVVVASKIIGELVTPVIEDLEQVEGLEFKMQNSRVFKTETHEKLAA